MPDQPFPPPPTSTWDRFVVWVILPVAVWGCIIAASFGAIWCIKNL
jgi:hypothetical protein